MSVRPAMAMRAFGRLIPLCSARRPPWTTVQVTSLPATSSTRSSIRPSLMRIGSPGATARGSAAKLVEMRSAVPATGAVVRTNALALVQA